jgi:RimJ/RimL family protein N-acetyltransferase
MLHTFGRNIVSDKILFGEGTPTALPANGATLHQLTPETDLHAVIAERAGRGQWALRLGATEIGAGELYFHYNAPYCDIAMQIAATHRRQGYGSYFVQELKRRARALGAVPAARCDPQNVASRATIARAGMVPRGHILLGELASR